MITCKDCGVGVDRLAIFPQDRCVDCHASVTPMPTTEELTRIWKDEELLRIWG
jgi:hypothetical protein